MEPTEETKDQLTEEQVVQPELASHTSTHLVEPLQTDALPPAKQPIHKRFNTKIVILVTAITIALVAGVATYWFVLRDESAGVDPSVITENATPTEAPVESTGPAVPTETPQPVVVDGITILATPEKQETGLFVNPDFMNLYCGDDSCKKSLVDVTYYKVAILPDGAGLYVAITPAYEITTPNNYWYSVKDGAYTALTNGVFYGGISEDWFYTQYGGSLQPNTKVDTVTVYKQLFVPATSQAGGQNVKSNLEGKYYAIFYPEGVNSLDNNATKVGTKDGMTYYTTTDNAVPEEGYEVKKFYGFKYNYFGSVYESDGEVAKSNIESIKILWTTGAKPAQVNYGRASQGCGAIHSYMAATGITKADLQAAGKTPGGQTVYALPTTSPLFKSIYTKDYSPNSQYLQDEALKNLSEAAFQEQHGIIIVENGNNELVVFLRGGMFVGSGCAKPVVYLYPEKTTLVDVQVGADVVISDPIYPAGGWKSVLAQPNGSLLYNGRTYSSLFWEGYGHGAYPDIAGRGVVVPTSQAAATIRDHLQQQGMQGQEIIDFMTFWEPRLPQTAYTRLTWLSGAELQRLAPLHVNPWPQTVIRVFLDFEGLDEYQALAPQQFFKPIRRGFTAVEWGGLARHGLESLYLR